MLVWNIFVCVCCVFFHTLLLSSFPPFFCCCCLLCHYVLCKPNITRNHSTNMNTTSNEPITNRVSLSGFFQYPGCPQQSYSIVAQRPSLQNLPAATERSWKRRDRNTTVSTSSRPEKGWGDSGFKSDSVDLPQWEPTRPRCLEQRQAAVSVQLSVWISSRLPKGQQSSATIQINRPR